MTSCHHEEMKKNVDKIPKKSVNQWLIQNVIVSLQTVWVLVQMLTVVTFGGVLANLSEQMSMQSLGVCDSTRTERYRSTCIGNTTTTTAT